MYKTKESAKKEYLKSKKNKILYFLWINKIKVFEKNNRLYKNPEVYIKTKINIFNPLTWLLLIILGVIETFMFYKNTMLPQIFKLFKYS